MGLQTVEEDGAVRGMFRSVREKIFEGNLPRLGIVVVQELEKLDRFIESEQEQSREKEKAEDLSELGLHD
jgi:hypothetical protein